MRVSTSYMSLSFGDHLEPLPFLHHAFRANFWWSQFLLFIHVLACPHSIMLTCYRLYDLVRSECSSGLLFKSRMLLRPNRQEDLHDCHRCVRLVWLMTLNLKRVRLWEPCASERFFRYIIVTIVGKHMMGFRWLCRVWRVYRVQSPPMHIFWPRVQGRPDFKAFCRR